MALGSNLMPLARNLYIGRGHRDFKPVVQIHFFRTSHTFTI